LRARAPELERDRLADPAGAAGDEGSLPLERAEAAHAVERVSSIRSMAATPFTGIVFTVRSIRLLSPERKFPSPISMNVFAPSLISAEADCVKRTGAASWSTTSGASRFADSIR